MYLTLSFLPKDYRTVSARGGLGRFAIGSRRARRHPMLRHACHWLYLHQLDTFAALGKLIAFYVEQHNTVVPHAAFAGQTPDEMYFGRGDHIPGELAAGHARARVARLGSNRQLPCEFVGPRSKTCLARLIRLQIRASCICTTKCLECRDSQLA
jgi:hypothetical protein